MRTPGVTVLIALVSVACIGAENYFPPPERAGGWRSLVPVNDEPSNEQKAVVREKAGRRGDQLSVTVEDDADSGKLDCLELNRRRP